MTFKTVVNLIMTWLLITASAFMPCCTETNHSDTNAEIMNATEFATANAHFLQPVSSDPAFTLDPDDPAIEWGPCPEFMPESCELAVIQGDPTEPNADVLFKMAPNTTVDEHWHTSTERMVLLSGEMVVDYDGQEPVTLEPGTYAYGPSGLPHETHCGDEGDCILFIAFEEPVDAISVHEQEAPGSYEEAFTITTDEAQFADCPPFMPESCGLGVIQGDPEEHNADIFFKMTPDTKVPNHRHTSAERMVLTSGQMQVNYEGQEPVILEPGTYAYGPAELPHDTVCMDQDEDCILFIAFEEPVDAIEVR